MRRVVLLAGVVLAVTSALSTGSAQMPVHRAFSQTAVAGFKPEPLTPFEARLVQQARTDGAFYENEMRPTADHNARGLILTGGSVAVVDLAVTGRKYGVSLDGTDDVLIKNFTFVGRRSMDRFGAGLILGSKTPTRGQTYLSNAYIDLKEPGPNPDYKLANNEAISVERRNGMLNVRQAVLIGAGEAGLDNKGDVTMDGVFIASGHRPVRVWSGGSLVLSNSIVLAMPGFGGFWFGGGKTTARLDYFNCKFGRFGDRLEDLSSEIPAWMIATEDDVDVRMTHLRKDPLDRRPGTFWVAVVTPIPHGFLAGR